jgi:hypothetical protein
LAHCVSPFVHLPHALVLAKHAGVSPPHVSSTVQSLPSALHVSTASSLQRLSPGVQATHFPSKQAAVGLVQAP